MTGKAPEFFGNARDPLLGLHAALEFELAVAEAGFDTLLATVDVPVAGARLRDVRNGMSIPVEKCPTMCFSSRRTSFDRE